MLNLQRENATLAEPEAAAASAGLRYVCDAAPGISRKKSGKTLVYLKPDGSRLTDPAELKRIRSLAIPPAWTGVWICSSPQGHLQATGRDDRGRKQYRYHPRFRKIRESTKFDHLVAFAEALPPLRTKIREHMALPGLRRDKVLATVVYLLDKTLIRIGNDDYARQNKSYGLTTLKSRHVEVSGTEVKFHFVGKSGRQWSARIRDPRVAKIIRACQELPGQELLQYRDEDGKVQDVTSSDVNQYLREMTGKDITAKDFRTWAGTVLAAAALSEIMPSGGPARPQRKLRAAIEQVATRLGNTVAICRKCYVHPDVIDAYLEGTLVREMATSSAKSARSKRWGLDPQEAAVLRLLRARPRAGGNRATMPTPKWLRYQLTRSVAALRGGKRRRPSATRQDATAARYFRAAS